MSAEYTIETFVKVNSLTISSDLAGATIPLAVEGTLSCEVEFPRDDTSAGELAVADLRQRYAYRLPPGASLVSFVKVTCRLVLKEAPSHPGNEPTREFWEWTHAAIGQARGIAFALVSRIVRAARVDGQYWLAAPGEQPIHVGRTRVFDSAERDLIPPGIMFASESARMIMPRAGATRRAVTDALNDRLTFERSADLLADAKYFALAAETQNLGLAIVLGAMACEIGVKQAMTDLAGAERVALVEAIIANPREVTMAALDLFNTGLKAVAGRSLRDDDRDTYKRLQKLFEFRNRYVHRGAVEPTADEVRDVLDAATVALDYVAGLTGVTGAEREKSAR